jgi:hypothetical protein
MRLPSRGLLIGIGFALAGGAFAQAPKPTTGPAIGGKRSVTTRETRSVTRVESTPIVTSETAPQPVGYESDLYCFGYVGDLNEVFPVEVHSAENVAMQTDYITGDLLYVTGGYDKGLRIGDAYWLVTPEQEIFSPATGNSLGRLYSYRGRAVVQSIEPHTAIVRVTSACTDIPLGAGLKKFEPIPIPLARRTPPAMPGDPPSGKATGHIVFTRDGVVAVGADNSVIVDLGLASGIQPGDFLTVFRYSIGTNYGIGPIGTYWVNLPPPPGVSVPRTYLGEAAVLMVGDRWAIARVTDSAHLIEVGDQIELK